LENVNACPPNSVSTVGELCICDEKGAFKCETNIQKSARLNCGKDEEIPYDGCGWNVCQNRLLSKTEYNNCPPKYEPCVIGSTYVTDRKEDCVCGADGQLRCVCPPNTIYLPDGDLISCDSQGVQRQETDEEKWTLRLKCGDDLEKYVYDGCNSCMCDGMCTDGSCISSYEPCTIGETYRTAGKKCICGKDGQLNCV
jgi:hypothetical protein